MKKYLFFPLAVLVCGLAGYLIWQHVFSPSTNYRRGYITGFEATAKLLRVDDARRSRAVGFLRQVGHGEQKMYRPISPPYAPIGQPYAPVGSSRSDIRLFACAFPPAALYQGRVWDYPSDLPSECPTSLYTGYKAEQVLGPAKKTDFWKLTDAVGRLEINAVDGSHQPTFWGTAFVIAEDVIATTCHTLDPLVVSAGDSTKLNLDPLKERLVVDFSDARKTIGKQCWLKNDVYCSTRAGLDVALIQIDDRSCTPPPPVPLYIGKIEDLVSADLEHAHLLGVVGYPDFNHFIDLDTEDLYAPYTPLQYAKFLMPAAVTEIDHYGDGVQLLLDVADTTMGESGSVLVDLASDIDHFNPTVAGIHACCSSYFGEIDEHAPQLDLACAHLKRTIYNQSVSIQSILADPKLCNILSQHKVKCR